MHYGQHMNSVDSQLPLSCDKNLKALNSLALPSVADFYIKAQTVDEILAAALMARSKQWPIYILGGGSNTVFPTAFHGLVIHIALKGIERLREDENHVYLQVAAGEIWDDFLQYCLQHDYFGLENMAIIPGTVGAAPIQNIGAYGLEVAEFIESVEAVDLHNGQKTVFMAEQCAFSYRDSIFKQQPNRYVITSVILRLNKTFNANLTYQALADVLTDETATAKALRKAVIDLRTSRLPDPNVLPNAGSFFKNPVVSEAAFLTLQNRYANIPHYPQPKGLVKLPAAWLIEQCGWRGRRMGDVGMYEKQALVLVNYADANFSDVSQLAAKIIADVEEKFAVILEPEPVFVGQ